MGASRAVGIGRALLCARCPVLCAKARRLLVSAPFQSDWIVTPLHGLAQPPRL
jgi:hypothetical protein